MLVASEAQEFLKAEEVHRTVPCCQFYLLQSQPSCFTASRSNVFQCLTVCA